MQRRKESLAGGGGEKTGCAVCVHPLDYYGQLSKLSLPSHQHAAVVAGDVSLGDVYAAASLATRLPSGCPSLCFKIDRCQTRT